MDDLVLDLLKIENLKYFFIFSFVSCGIIEGIKRGIMRFVEMATKKFPTIQEYLLQGIKALSSLLPLPFGFYTGKLLFKVSESALDEEKKLYVFFMIGITYVMYFFLFKTVIEMLKGKARKWKR